MKDRTFETNFFDCMSLTPHGFTIYKDFIRNKVRFNDERHFESDSENSTNEIKEDTVNSSQHAERLKTKGIMSPQATRKMRTAVEWLLLLAKPKREWCKSSKRWIKFKVCFVTLTLPSCQVHSDQEIKKLCLNQLLIELKRYNGLHNYIWRAEKQINGNIHFHLVMDKFIEASVLRLRWNRIINKLGYIDKYTDRMNQNIKNFSDYYNEFINQGSYAQLFKRYCHGKTSNWKNPNSTDIHSVRKIKNLVSYLLKYMSKNVEEPELLSDSDKEKLLVSGQLWGLSESLSKMRNVIIPISSEIQEEINRLWDNVKTLFIKDEWFTYKVCSLKNVVENDCKLIMKYVYEKLIEVFGIYELRFV